MKRISNNPLIWAIALCILGWLMSEGGSFDVFLILASAVIVAKEIEILNSLKK